MTSSTLMGVHLSTTTMKPLYLDHMTKRVRNVLKVCSPTTNQQGIDLFMVDNQ
jgi:hypothetical protein